MTARRIPDGDRALFRRACDVLRALTAKGYKPFVDDDGVARLEADGRVVERVSLTGTSGGEAGRGA